MNLKPRLCEYPGCYKKHKARGYCRSHYNKFLVKRDPAKKKFVDWEALNRQAMDQFLEWKQNNQPFKIDDGEYQQLKTR